MRIARRLLLPSLKSSLGSRFMSNQGLIRALLFRSVLMGLCLITGSHCYKRQSPSTAEKPRADELFQYLLSFIGLSRDYSIIKPGKCNLKQLGTPVLA